MAKAKKMTEEEIKDAEAEIVALKQLLKQTDYQALKFAEGQIPEAEYTEIREKRQGFRDEINALQDKLEDQTVENA